MHAKAKGGYNLDAATAHCKELDHFVMWSSFVASAGNEGQTNYGYANACLDALSESRKSRGLPSLSVQWGVIDHVGVADKNIQVSPFRCANCCCALVQKFCLIHPGADFC